MSVPSKENFALSKCLSKHAVAQPCRHNQWSVGRAKRCIHKFTILNLKCCMSARKISLRRWSGAAAHLRGNIDRRWEHLIEAKQVRIWSLTEPVPRWLASCNKIACTKHSLFYWGPVRKIIPSLNRAAVQKRLPTLGTQRTSKTIQNSSWMLLTRFVLRSSRFQFIFVWPVELVSDEDSPSRCSRTIISYLSRNNRYILLKQSRRQKVFHRSALLLCREVDILKLDKNSTFFVLHLSVWGAKPTVATVLNWRLVYKRQHRTDLLQKPR